MAASPHEYLAQFISEFFNLGRVSGALMLPWPWCHGHQAMPGSCPDASEPMFAWYLFAKVITLLVSSASCWHLIFSAVAFSN